MDDTQRRFEGLFRAHEGDIRAYCARRLDGGSVDDAVAETFSVVWRKLDEVPEGTASLPWLYGAAHRVIQHAWRSNGRRARLRSRSVSILERPRDGVADQYIEDEDRRLVLDAAKNLSDDDREILRLTLWEELTPTEAAVVLGVSADAAKQRANRARKRLAAEFRRLARPSSTNAAAWRNSS